MIIKTTIKHIPDREKIEGLCQAAGHNVIRYDRSTIVDDRRFFFDKAGCITKILVNKKYREKEIGPWNG